MDPAKPRSGDTQFPLVNALRGVAALAVCWFHVSGLLPSAFSTWVGRYGFMGVQVFFVVSGFVIPYALHRGKYRVAMVGRFLAKRMLRLQPPYLTVVLAIAAPRWVANTFELHSYTISWPQVLAHAVYANAFLGLPWLLDSFWTLAVEFQYYLAIGVVFPLIARRGWITALAIAILTGAAALLFPSGGNLPHHLPFFVLGIAVFRRIALKAPFAETILLFFAAAAFGRVTYGWIAAAVGLSTAMLILFAHYSNRALDTLGDISYSLYLTHPLLAWMFLGQAARFPDTPISQTTLLIATVGGCVAGAWPLYRYVEMPSKRWAASIRYSATPKYTERKVPVHS